MPRKQKINYEKVYAALSTVCPLCGYSIPPAEIQRLGSGTMKCPKCGEVFAANQKRGLTTMYEYLAVRCRECHRLTAIREIKYESRKFELALAVPFPVVCIHCKAVQQFGGYPVTLIQVPERIENLPDLPTFQ